MSKTVGTNYRKSNTVIAVNGEAVKQRDSKSGELKPFSKNKKPSNEIKQLESEIPELAAAASRIAVSESFNNDLKIVIVEDGNIVEVAPDDTRQIIKKAPEQLHLEEGSIFDLK